MPASPDRPAGFKVQKVGQVILARFGERFLERNGQFGIFKLGFPKSILDKEEEKERQEKNRQSQQSGQRGETEVSYQESVNEDQEEQHEKIRRNLFARLDESETEKLVVFNGLEND
jgi:hypothetical protein